MDFLFSLLPHLANGVSLGLLFALIALGFMLIVGVMETINLAHGSLFALGMYFALFIVAPKLGGAKLSDGKRMPADGQLAGTPSTVFDAVALVLSAEGGKQLSREAAAVDWARDAFGHLKAIAADAGAQAVLKAGGIAKDAGVLDAADAKGFITQAKTRQWDREKKVRMLA